MKTALAIAALLAAAAIPTLAAAKPGDQYLNRDGSCNPGDKKKAGWCIESLKVGPGDTGKTGSAKAEEPRQKRILPKTAGAFTEKPMP